MFKSKVRKYVLTGQSREVLANVLKFMQNETDSQLLRFPIKKVTKRVSAATGVSRNAVKKIKTELMYLEKQLADGKSAEFQEPVLDETFIAPKSNNLSDCDKCLLRRIIHDIYVTEKIMPCISKIHQEFIDAVSYSGSKADLFKEIKELGFYFQQTKSNRKILLERESVRYERVQYLRNINELRNRGRIIIYTGETQVYIRDNLLERADKSTKHALQQCFILLQACSEKGIVNGPELTLHVQSVSDRLQKKISFEQYKHWLKHFLVPSLPPNSVVVFNDSPFRNVLVEKCPSSVAKRIDMMKWLDTKNITYTESMLKSELYELIENTQEQYNTPVIDDLLKRHGHDVIWIPPHYPDLNPMAYFGILLKEFVEKMNTSRNIKEMADLCKTWLKNLPPKECKSQFKCVENIELKYLNNESKSEEFIEKQMEHFGYTSDSPSGTEDDSDEED